MVSFVPTDDADRGGDGAGDTGLAPVVSLSAARRARGSSPERTAPEDVEIPPPGIEEIADAVVRSLGRRSLSEREVTALLVEKGAEPHAAAEVLERFRDYGYVDDARLAEELVRKHSEGKGRSRAVVARTLAERGIPSEVAETALEAVEPERELATATELASKRLRQMRGLDDETATRRLSGYLARRGYSGSTVRRAIDAAKAEDRGGAVRFR